MQVLKNIFSLLNGAVWLTVGSYVLLLVLTNVPLLPIPQLSFSAFVITSGSMEPTINTGDLIFSRRSETYQPQDIITYKLPELPIITHRIIGISESTSTEPHFITKGDNNEDPDTVAVPTSKILGKYFFHFPLVGYLLFYGKSPLGLILLIGLPIVLMIIEATFFPNDKKKPSIVPTTQRSASPNAP